jgi:hypothetical protein
MRDRDHARQQIEHGSIERRAWLHELSPKIIGLITCLLLALSARWKINCKLGLVRRRNRRSLNPTTGAKSADRPELNTTNVSGTLTRSLSNRHARNRGRRQHDTGGSID